MAVSPADLESKTVALVLFRNGEGRAYCSGVWVGVDAILTANHCVDDLELGEHLLYVTRTDVAADHVDEVALARLAVLAGRDVTHDLALLRVLYPPEHGTALVASDAPYVGMPVATEGHPLGLYWNFSTGVLSSVRQLPVGDDLDPDMWWLVSSAPISPGNSGGGLWSSRGELLGIAHAYFPRGQNLNIYVGAADIRAFLAASLP